MAKKHFLLNRLKVKTQLYRFINRLISYYSLSLAAAELLSKEIIDEMSTNNPEYLQDGQIWYTAIHKDEPAGKELSKCSKVRIKLTLQHPDDLDINDTHLLKSRLVHRLSWEAIKQNATLSIEDLSRILLTSEKTIRRLIAEYRAKEIIIPLRGFYKDIGPGTTHKAQAIRLFLKGMMPSQIANFLAHSLSSIERYLNDFCIVMMGIDEGYSVVRIARNTKLSERLVTEYQILYQQYREKPEYQPRLSQLKERLDYLLKKKTNLEEAL